MKKSELKTGMSIMMRSGEVCRVIKDVDTVKYGNQDFILCDLGIKGFEISSKYNNNMKHKTDKIYDIVEVFKKEDDGDILFDEINKPSIWKEPVRQINMTVAEIEAKLDIKNLHIVKEGE